MENTSKEIKKAKEILDEISSDERERYLAELRQKHIMDQKAIEGAGYDKGVKAGIERGIKREKREVAQYNIPIDVDTIKEGYPILCA